LFQHAVDASCLNSVKVKGYICCNLDRTLGSDNNTPTITQVIWLYFTGR